MDHPLTALFGDGARQRFVAVFLDADVALNPTEACRRADVERQSWYRHVDDLEDSGLVVQVGTAGNSPLYRAAETQVVAKLREVIAMQQEADNGTS